MMAAHNPLSARLAEEAGFDGIWASGFELSAAYGVPDASLLVVTQHLDMTRAIIEQVAIPMVADLDTGYGNAINVVACRRRLCAGRGRRRWSSRTRPSRRTPACSPAAGRSWSGSRNSRARSRRRARRGRGHDLLVIARTEALIADLGIDEALRRGAAYAEAGADLLLIHSKQKTPDEIVAFTERLAGRRSRSTIVPTAYPDLTEAKAARSARSAS